MSFSATPATNMMQAGTQSWGLEDQNRDLG